MNDYAHKHISMYIVQCVLFYYYYSNCIFIFLGGGQTNGQTCDGLCIVLGEGRYSSCNCWCWKAVVTRVLNVYFHANINIKSLILFLKCFYTILITPVGLLKICCVPLVIVKATSYSNF